MKSEREKGFRVFLANNSGKTVEFSYSMKIRIFRCTHETNRREAHSLSLPSDSSVEDSPPFSALMGSRIKTDGESDTSVAAYVAWWPLRLPLTEAPPITLQTSGGGATTFDMRNLIRFLRP